MKTSETYKCPCGEWQETPQWLRWLGKPAFRRQLYAWWNIGGGLDGYEYCVSPER